MDTVENWFLAVLRSTDALCLASRSRMLFDSQARAAKQRAVEEEARKQAEEAKKIQRFWRRKAEERHRRVLEERRRVWREADRREAEEWRRARQRQRSEVTCGSILGQVARKFYDLTCDVAIFSASDAGALCLPDHLHVAGNVFELWVETRLLVVN